MMTGKVYLLDTNIVIYLMKAETKVVDLIFNSESIFIVPSIVAGELYFGAENSTNQTKHLEQTEALLNEFTILSIDEATSQHYGRVKSELRKAGTPIPENDIWIAALAR